MDNSRLYFHSNQARPYFYMGQIPVYLTTLLVMIHVLVMLLGVIFGVGNIFTIAALDTSSVIADSKYWQVVTYVFCDQISIGFIINMVMLFSFGRQLEEIFGRKTFGWIYGSAILVPALIAVIDNKIDDRAIHLMAGAMIPHFCLLLGVALFQPNVFMFFPWLKLKWVASAIFTVDVLICIQNRNWNYLIGLVSACAITYVLLRRAGLGVRFEALESALKTPWMPRKLKSAFKALPGGKPAKSRDGNVYEPKLVPRPELEAEHPAVVEIDAVLDKISKTGFGSLTDKEKLALDRASEELKAKDKRR